MSFNTGFFGLTQIGKQTKTQMLVLKIEKLSFLRKPIEILNLNLKCKLKERNKIEIRFDIIN